MKMVKQMKINIRIKNGGAVLAPGASKEIEMDIKAEDFEKDKFTIKSIVSNVLQEVLR